MKNKTRRQRHKDDRRLTKKGAHKLSADENAAARVGLNGESANLRVEADALPTPRKADTDHIIELLAMDVGMLAPVLASPPDRRTIASMLLMAAKLQDKEILKDDSLLRAKLAAKVVEATEDLAPALGQVLLAIKTNDKRFFIDFGKCLSGEIKDPTVFDKRDRDIAEIVVFHPQMSARDAVRELGKRGHRGITEDNFRMRKMRLLKAKAWFHKKSSAVSAEASV
jgi:hypothetical protein